MWRTGSSDISLSEILQKKFHPSWLIAWAGLGVLGASTDEIPTITDIEVENTNGQINWLVIMLTLLGTFGYIIYEWRSEISHNFTRAKLQFKNR